jgi:hypothetical protein
MKYSPSTIEVFVGFLGGLIERLGRLNWEAPRMTLSFLAERCTSLKVAFSATSVEVSDNSRFWLTCRRRTHRKAPIRIDKGVSFDIYFDSAPFPK